jgi:hypothetical protein
MEPASRIHQLETHRAALSRVQLAETIAPSRQLPRAVLSGLRNRLRSRLTNCTMFRCRILEAVTEGDFRLELVPPETLCHVILNLIDQEEGGNDEPMRPKALPQLNSGTVR